MEWADDNPYFLLLTTPDKSEAIEIDLGVKGWAKTYADWMRRPGWWFLCRKNDKQVVLVQTVFDGEQPYYTKRHIGQINTGGGVGRETSCYGIGKKRVDGHVDRLWILPDGIAICGGDDVEVIAMEVVKTLAWQELPPE